MSDTKLRDIISQMKHTKIATDTGKKMHTKMQGIIISDTAPHGDAEICEKISQHPELTRFFAQESKTEAPIAGYINGQFISRRIDRLIIDDANKTIDILDYKTDTNKNEFIDKYTTQINEYATLLRDIYPQHTIHGYILWLHDFELTKIV